MKENLMKELWKIYIDFADNTAGIMGAAPRYPFVDGRTVHIHIRSTFPCHSSSAFGGLDFADQIHAAPRFRHLWMPGKLQSLNSLFTLVSTICIEWKIARGASQTNKQTCDCISIFRPYYNIYITHTHSLAVQFATAIKTFISIATDIQLSLMQCQWDQLIAGGNRWSTTL